MRRSVLPSGKSANGKVLRASLEEAEAGEGHIRIQRPVLRLFQQGITLTRISPERRETSMLFRTRPNWSRLRQYLEGCAPAFSVATSTAKSLICNLDYCKGRMHKHPATELLSGLFDTCQCFGRW